MAKVTHGYAASGSYANAWDWADAWASYYNNLNISQISAYVDEYMMPAGPQPWPSLIINGVYEMKVKASGQGELRYKGETVGSAAGMPGNNQTLIAYSPDFVYVVFHGNNLLGGNQTFSMFSSSSELHSMDGWNYFNGQFNSIDKLTLYDRDGIIYQFASLLSYDKPSGILDLMPLSLYRNYVKDISIFHDFYSCTTLPLGSCRQHQVVTINNDKYYLAGANTLIKLDS